MANYNQAPELKHNGVKSQETQFYKIPQDLADIIFNELGNSSAQLRIMMVLIGTKEGFKVSEQWMLDRTGLLHASYIKARKALVDKGWLSLDAANSITVNYDVIRKKSRSNMVLPQCSNTVLPQRSNMVLPITDKETDKKTDKVGLLSNLIKDCSSSDGSFKM